jgi:hypothetical protein
MFDYYHATYTIITFRARGGNRYGLIVEITSLVNNVGSLKYHFAKLNLEYIVEAASDSLSNIVGVPLPAKSFFTEWSQARFATKGI